MRRTTGIEKMSAVRGSGYVSIAGIFAVAGILYLPLGLQRFGLSDDYSMLSTPLRDPGRLTEFVVGMGRLWCGPLLEWTGLHLATVEQLIWTRLAAVLGLVIWALGLDWCARGAGWTPVTRLGAIVLTLASPSASILAGWSVCWPYPYAAILALVGFVASERVLRLEGLPRGASSGRWGQMCGWMGLSALSILSAAFLYQPFIFCYLAPLLCRLLPAREEVSGGILGRWLLLHLVWLGGVAVGSFLLYRGVVHWLGIEVVGRTALVSDPLAKAHWMFTSLLPNGLNFVTLRGHRGEGTLGWVLVGMLVCLVLGYSLLRRAFRTGWKDIAFTIGAVGTLLLASISLLLVIEESYASYRILFPFVGLVALWMVWEGSAAMHLSTWMRPLVVGLFLVVTGFGVWRNHALLAAPQARELELVEGALGRLDWEQEPKIFIIQPTMNDALAAIVATNEFGLPSTYADWALEGIVWLYAEQRGRRDAYSLNYGYALPLTLDPEVVVIDLPAIFAAAK